MSDADHDSGSMELPACYTQVQQDLELYVEQEALDQAVRALVEIILENPQQWEGVDPRLAFFRAVPAQTVRDWMASQYPLGANRGASWIEPSVDPPRGALEGDCYTDPVTNLSYMLDCRWMQFAGPGPGDLGAREYVDDQQVPVVDELPMLGSVGDVVVYDGDVLEYNGQAWVPVRSVTFQGDGIWQPGNQMSIDEDYIKAIFMKGLQLGEMELIAKDMTQELNVDRLRGRAHVLLELIQNFKKGLAK